MTQEGPRVLRQTLDYFNLQTDTEANPIVSAGDGWTNIDLNTRVARTYYDLSGYNMEDLTSFFQAVEVQEASFNSTDMTQLDIVDLITTEYVDDASVLLAAQPNGRGAPGFPESTFNLEQVVYGRRRTWARTNSNNIGQITPPFNECTWGTCLAASADKIHITRIVYTPILGASEFVNCSPSCFVTGIIVGKEDSLPYLMRQKRSYELATGP